MKGGDSLLVIMVAVAGGCCGCWRLFCGVLPTRVVAVDAHCR